MRLINIWTLELAEFVDPPPYAILSHRWEAGEIKHEEYIDAQRQFGAGHGTELGPGFNKIARFCAFLRNLNAHPQTFQENIPSLHYRGGTDLHWAWVDTCCIDKRSSAELSESINSMWRWYRDAAFCVAHLADLSITHSVRQWHSDFVQSEWFTRGWTLQELLAPEVIIFCDADWRHFGIKTVGSDMHNQFLELISSASSIPVVYLQGYAPSSSASVAQRMSWASNRVTTRPEDTAYCLFGLFDLHLPLLYGEGRAAFQRLQEEIIRTSDDETIFAWKQPRHEDHGHSVLAYSPARFADSGLMQRYSFFPREPYTVTHKGIQIKAELSKFEGSEYYLPLNCIELAKEELLENMYRPTGISKARPCLLRLRQTDDGTFEPFGIARLRQTDDGTFEPFGIARGSYGKCLSGQPTSESTKLEAMVIHLQHQPFAAREEIYLSHVVLSHGYQIVGDDCGSGWDLTGRRLDLHTTEEIEVTERMRK